MPQNAISPAPSDQQPALTGKRRPALKLVPAPANKRKRALALTKRQAGRGENYLADDALRCYFGELTQLAVLEPEAEFTAAREFEAREVDLWQAIFRQPHLVREVARVALSLLETLPKDLENFCRSVMKDDVAHDIDVARVSLSKRSITRAATTAQRIDIDRRLIAAVMGEVRRLQRVSAATTDGVAAPSRERSLPDQDHLTDICGKFAMVQQVRNAFVSANLRLVVSIARRFSYSQMPLADLIQEGNVGLIKAVERYDYRKGFRFSTYASWWIRHTIGRAVADKGRLVRLPVHVMDAQHKLARARRDLTARLGRLPTTEEASRESGLSREKVIKVDRTCTEPTVSLHREMGWEDRRLWVDMIHDPEQTLPGDELEQRVMSERVMQLIETLKPIEADILRQRFGLIDDQEQTLRELGRQYDLSRERIRQLQEQALSKIRDALAGA